MSVIELNENALFLIQLSIIIILPYLIWLIKAINKYIPLVVVQILIGMAFGPSVLGKISNEFYNLLWPQKSLFIIDSIGVIAVILFCFVVGMEFDIAKIKNKGAAFGITAVSSIIIPFLLCVLSGLFLVKLPNLVGERADDTIFIIGVAIAGSVTALPVLSSILYELKYTGKYIGNLAIGMATVNDGILWIMISLMVVFSSGMGNVLNILKIVLYMSVYIFFILIFMKPFLKNIERYFSKKETKIENHKISIFIVVIAMLFISAFLTELIGMHYFIGAFIMGMIIPKNIAQEIYLTINDFLKTILLPFYFVSTGLKTNVSIGENAAWFIFVMISISAIIGKIFGTALISKKIGLTSTYADSIKLGNFMSCKGLMEVIVLNILLSTQIITIEAFSGLILMAVLTTALTKPLHIFITNKNEKLHHKRIEAE